jgi:2-octaprenyl-6-methoxyphenol hydroxylase
LRDAVATSGAAADIDAALSRVAWQRAPDRWAMIAATDFLARSFTWQAPGIATLRGAGMALLDRLPPLKNALARRMMFGSR